MHPCLPTPLIAALICAFAGAAVAEAPTQSGTAPAAAPPAPLERRVDPGPAPAMPCIGGRSGACCDHPDLAYHPRCQEWQTTYERWRRAYDAFHRG